MIKYFIFFIPELLSVYELLKKEHVDIVHCNGTWQIKGILGGWLCGAGVIWHLNDTRVVGFINTMFKLLALRLCHGFITAGERVRIHYCNDRRFSKKLVMEIQAPVDTSSFDPDRVESDQTLENFDGLRIVTVGNVNPAKGFEYFIEMASILNKQYGNLTFVVVGPHFESQKKYSEKLRSLVKRLRMDNLVFYGRSSDVASVLKAADIYVCSSVSEASPMSVWEAMSMARPIVSSNVGDVAKFIKDRENGFVVPVKNPAALAEKAGMLIENRDLRRIFGEKARDVAIQYLDVEICVRKHAEFYRQVMKMS
ncbi:MAG: hypothetical protein BA874_09645 [Desulfuromonadales bacterium C00003068]|nr:MAG: hypothetical protein BA874_09645 [Desulfuromonadales bacterium C00003068]